MSNKEDFFHYLPVDESAMTWGAYVTGAGRGHIPPGVTYPRQGHPVLYHFDWRRGRILPEFQLILLTEGSGQFESEATGLVEFSGDTLVILFPGLWHRYQPHHETGWVERWISFNGELVHRLFNIGLFEPQAAVSTPRDANRLRDAFDEVLDDIQKHPMQHSVLLSLQALGLISEAAAKKLDRASRAESQLEADSEPRDPIVQQALEMVWSRSHYPLSVSDIARQLPVTRRTLDRRFSEATGHSVLDEINACRLSRAKRLLLETDLPVKTVAHLAGFSSAERMRVAFVEKEGVSPTTFREQGNRRVRSGTGSGGPRK